MTTNPVKKSVAIPAPHKILHVNESNPSASNARKSDFKAKETVPEIDKAPDFDTDPNDDSTSNDLTSNDLASDDLRAEHCSGTRYRSSIFQRANINDTPDDPNDDNTSNDLESDDCDSEQEEQIFYQGNVKGHKRSHSM